MKPYQIVLVVILVLGGLGGAIGLFGFNLTAGIANAGTSFLKQIATAGPDAAYASAAPVFRAQTSRGALAGLAQRLGLADLEDVSWSSRSFSGSSGTIRGTATLKSGTKLPIEMTLVKQNDVWLVASMAVTGGLPAGGGENQPKN